MPLRAVQVPVLQQDSLASGHGSCQNVSHHEMHCPPSAHRWQCTVAVVLASHIHCANALSPATAEQVLCAPDAYVVATIVRAGGIDCLPRFPRKCYFPEFITSLRIIKVVATRQTAEQDKWRTPKAGETYVGQSRIFHPSAEPYVQYIPVSDEEISQLLDGRLYVLGINGYTTTPPYTFYSATGTLYRGETELKSFAARLEAATEPGCPRPLP